MKWRAAVKFLGLVAFISLASIRQSSACSCIDVDSKTRLINADVVFEGHVVDKGKRGLFDWDTGFTTFAIRKKYKGDIAKSIRIYHGLNGASCGTGFNEGQDYVIFAGVDDKGEYWTGLCSGNALVKSEYANTGPLTDYVVEKNKLDEMLHKKTVNGEILLQNAQLALEYQEYHLVKKALEKHDKSFPASAKSLSLWGDFHYKQQNYVDALNNYDNALAIDPLFQLARKGKTESLLRMGKLEEALLSGTNFTGYKNTRDTPLDFSGKDLTGYIFDNADLTGVNFSGAQISNASFRNARLNQCDFKNATLKDTDFSSADPQAEIKGSSISASDFSGAKLTRVTFHGAAIGSTSFKGASLYKTGLADARIWGADFTKAAFDQADFSGASIERGNFSQATFVGTKWIKMKIRNSDLNNVVFIDSELRELDFGHASGEEITDLRGADLSGLGMENTRFSKGIIDCNTRLPKDIKLEKEMFLVVWTNCDKPKPLTGLSSPLNYGVNIFFYKKVFDNDDITNQNIRHFKTMSHMSANNTDFSGSDFSYMQLSLSDFDGATFDNAKMVGIRASQSDFFKASLINANLEKAEFFLSMFNGADFTGANLSGVKIKQSCYDEKTIWPEGFVISQHDLAICDRELIVEQERIRSQH